MLTHYQLNGTFAYLLNELNQTINVYRVNATMARLDPPVQTGLSSLPMDVRPDNMALRGRAAEIFMHPNGRFLYTSTRLDQGTLNMSTGRYAYNTGVLEGWIGIYEVDQMTGRLTAKGFEKVNREPRGFGLDPTGRYLIVAGVSDPAGNLVSYKIDTTTGLLTKAARRSCRTAPTSPRSRSS